MTRPSPQDLAPLTDALLAAARAAGATEADAVAVAGESLSVEVRGRALEHAERADGIEIGLRVIVNGRQACVSASDRSDRTIREMAERADKIGQLNLSPDLLRELMAKDETVSRTPAPVATTTPTPRR